MGKHAISDISSCDTCGEYVPAAWKPEPDGFVECDSCAEDRFDAYEASLANGYEEAFILDTVEAAAEFVRAVTDFPPYKLTYRHRVQILLDPLDGTLRLRNLLRVLVIAHLIAR